MEFFKIAILVLIVVIMVSSIPTFSKEITVIITVGSCIVVLVYILNQAQGALEYIKNIADRMSFDGLEVVLKAVGVGFITQFVSDMALDCNNKSLSNQIIFAGRITVLLLAMPVFLQVFEIIERLLG